MGRVPLPSRRQIRMRLEHERVEKLLGWLEEKYLGKKREERKIIKNQ